MLKTEGKPVDFVINPFYQGKYEGEVLTHFQKNRINNILTFQQTHPLYAKTPLISLRELSKYLGLGSIHVKDESHRFGLNAFKVMGGIYAIGKYLANRLGKDVSDLSFTELQSEKVKDQLGEITFISATDGNHGRGVAWAARELGQKSVIYLPKGATNERLEAIRKEGAHAEITDVNYDETVARCAELADRNGWVLIQDTAWEGYEEIPLWIMQGYAAIAKEIVDELERDSIKAPTHLILQAGVGSFAAGILSYFLANEENTPKVILVEPDLAACYYQSFSEGKGEVVPVTGEMNSMMAGLCCGVPNSQAFTILKETTYASFSCPDWVAGSGMRVLGNPLPGDTPITSGESGAVPVGLLYQLYQSENRDLREELGLDESSRVLTISTEGDTDVENYRQVVWNARDLN